MSQIIFVAADGSEFPVDAKIGDSVMRAATAKGIRGIEAECGGALACATCRVEIPSDWQQRLPAASDAEREMLECCDFAAPVTRLSCQIMVTEELGGLRVMVPDSQY